MRRTYQRKRARASAATDVVPETATIAVTEIVESAREGYWRSLSAPGLQVMQVMMAESMIALGGPTGNTTQTGSGLGTGCGPGR